jgi:hypothetical protein
MKWIWLVFDCCFAGLLPAQNLQLHYDMRHSIDPNHTNRNFTTLYFEYFKQIDTGKAFIQPGNFLLKMQADFSGEKNNMSQFFMQVSQSFKLWQPDFFINLQYNGGLGITEPKQYSYYITSTYSVGISYPFKWNNAYMTSVLNYRYVSYKKPSNDLLYTLYWWKGLWNYKAELAGDFSIWTENKNRGDELTQKLKGKRFYFFAEPQFWYRIKNNFSAGAKVNMFYHVLTTENKLNIYPTLALRYKF